MLALVMCLMIVGPTVGQNLQRNENGGPDYFPPPDPRERYDKEIRIDRYLDVEIWTNHLDGDYYVGDKVVINFRANRDAFVAIYSVDSRGRVNLLFPSYPNQDNYIYGGATYSLPGPDDDYDLVVAGPEGVENIQIIASRERFPIPDWYPVSGLVSDWDDRLEYMDYLNGRYFVRYGGQKFAFDRTALYVNEWEPYYFRPVYYPSYPSWAVSGNAYIDYPWGATIYIDGIYWGVAPLYIPRIYVGWHTITVYDSYGYCWEQDVHFTRYHTVVLDRTIIKPSRYNVSKYKEVRTVAYRDPVSNGYPRFKEKKALSMKTAGVKSKTRSAGGSKAGFNAVPSKKYVRGTTKMVETDRGLESAGGTIDFGKRKYSTKRGTYKSKVGVGYGSSKSTGSTGYKTKNYGSSSGSYGSGGKRSGSSKIDKGSSGSDKSKGYYQKKSGSKKQRGRTESKKYRSKKSDVKKTSRGNKPSVKSRSKPSQSRPATKTVRPSGGKSTGGKASSRSSGGARNKSGGGRSHKGGHR